MPKAEPYLVDVGGELRIKASPLLGGEQTGWMATIRNAGDLNCIGRRCRLAYRFARSVGFRFSRHKANPDDDTGDENHR